MLHLHRCLAPSAGRGLLLRRSSRPATTPGRGAAAGPRPPRRCTHASAAALLDAPQQAAAEEPSTRPPQQQQHQPQEAASGEPGGGDSEQQQQQHQHQHQQPHPSTSYSSDDPAGDDLPTMQLDLPPPQHVRIKQAEFVKSSVQVADCPPPRYPDIAVIGRSNVGKSSLINMLTNRKALALVSKEPGKTRCINHFIINNNWYLVDLPGYGYAKVGKDSRATFDSFTRAYFLGRSNLAMVLQLVDSSIPPQDLDLEYSAWLASQGVPFTLVFTKADKRKKGAPAKAANVLAYKQALLRERGFSSLPPSLLTSAAAGTGKQELLSYLASVRVMYEQHHQP